MQLGTRWAVGATPPERLADNEHVLAAIRAEETELAALTDTDTSQWRWTLTWLEGRPVVELDDGTTIRQASDGSATVSHHSA